MDNSGVGLIFKEVNHQRCLLHFQSTMTHLSLLPLHLLKIASMLYFLFKWYFSVPFSSPKPLLFLHPVSLSSLCLTLLLFFHEAPFFPRPSHRQSVIVNPSLNLRAIAVTSWKRKKINSFLQMLWNLEFPKHVLVSSVRRSNLDRRPGWDQYS